MPGFPATQMSWIRGSTHLIFSRRSTLSHAFSSLSAWLIENSGDPAARITIALFIAFVLPTSLSLALLVPPGEMADEPAHIARAASLLRGEVIAKPATVMVDGKQVRIGGVICNTALFQAESSFPGILWPKPKKMTRQNLERLQAIPWAKAATFVPVRNTAVYFPVFYIPAAITIGLAKDLHFSPRFLALAW